MVRFLALVITGECKSSGGLKLEDAYRYKDQGSKDDFFIILLEKYSL